MQLLKKLFIKNYKDTQDPKVRLTYGTVAGIFGIISNVILFIGKILIGVIGNSIAIIADAINNLSDAGTSVVTIVGFKLASKPADSKHPYGHARYEYITGLIIGIIIFTVGVMLGKSSIEKIITPDVTTVTIYTYIVLAISIVLKLVQMYVYLDFSKSINSQTLKASSKDSLNDVLSTCAVLVSAIIISLVDSTVSIDGIFGLALSAYIIVSTCLMIKDIISPLLGEKADPEFVKAVTDKILSYPGVLGVHDMLVHSYGVGASYIMLHVEVDAKVDVSLSHDLIDVIEHDVAEEFKVHISIHMDPIVIDDEKVTYLHDIVKQGLREMNPDYKFHDFRVVFGPTHTTLLFDVVTTFEDKTTKDEIISHLSKLLSDYKPACFFVIEIDRIY
ncbi:MAG: cation diffusion facilitator family transporter [Clostridia bacterium]|nr:cation diffusion facilitator family transporter [Clostridia bacterium]